MNGLHLEVSVQRAIYGMLLLLLASCAGRDGMDGSVSELEISLTDVTEIAGLGHAYHENGAAGKLYYPEMMGSGGAFIDYDSDGWLDIIFMGGGAWEEDAGSDPQSVWLFQSRKDGTFRDVTEEVGLNGYFGYTLGQSSADYDNDGDEDLYITTLTRNLFFRNDGGRFIEVGEEIGLGKESVWSSSALFFDANHDGWLDLYVANYADWTPENDKWCPEGSPIKYYCLPSDYDGIASKYFRNNGDGSFTERSWEDGFLPAIGKSLGIVEMDYNRDGWVDIAVSNDGEGDLLYENLGDGSFRERGVQAGLAFSEHGEARSGMGIDAGVVDSTGNVTIFIGHFTEETSGVFTHLGNGLFRDRAAVSRIGHSSLMRLTFGVTLFDVEYDGDLDLFAANGHVQPDRLTDDSGPYTFRQPAQLFINNGSGTFKEFQGTEDVWNERLVARASSYGDFDKDGDLDIMMSECDGGIRLWRNDSRTGHFLRVRLTGTRSNRDALGSRVEATLGDYRMIRRIRTGSSYLSQMEKVATFGLGSADSVDSLLVFWPSGRVDQFADIPVNQEIHLTEGESGYTAVPLQGRDAEE